MKINKAQSSLISRQMKYMPILSYINNKYNEFINIFKNTLLNWQ